MAPASDSLDHEDLSVDCGYTKVIACRVGALGASLVRSARPGDRTRLMRSRHPCYDSSATNTLSYIPRIPPGKLRGFTLKELQEATSNFSPTRLIGRGGFGDVFKGKLSDGTTVAVKVLAKSSAQGSEQFQAEMTASYAIMSGSYTNLVPAIGYHSSKVNVMIVYPFMVNEDVGRYLDDSKPPRSPLDWPTRKRIALGIARGILRLHELGIVHRDIKPSNVLLDEDFNAHIGDLGLAKSIGLPHASDIHVDEDIPECVTGVCGTFAYLAPEYYWWGHISRKTDVYSFGVTLIQLVTGMPAVNYAYKPVNIVLKAEQLLKNNEDFFLFGGKNKEDLTRHMHGMLGMYDESEAIDLIRLGLVCTQFHSERRPLMPEVIAIMEGSGNALEKRWDNYESSSTAAGFYISSPSTTTSSPSTTTTVYTVGAGGNERGDNDGEADGENGETGNRLGRVEDFHPEESNFEQLADDAWDVHQGDQSPVSCSNYGPSTDASIWDAELNSNINAGSLENGIFPVTVGADQNGRGNLLHRSSQGDHQEGQPDKFTAKLKQMLDERREMELKYQAAMEEMHQKQMEIMKSMIKMQEEYIQKVNQMQFQIDQLEEEKM